MAKTNPTKTADTTALDYEEGGRRAERWLRLSREWDERRIGNPHDPNLGHSRGELTRERDQALRDLRAWIDPVIDSEVKAAQ